MCLSSDCLAGQGMQGLVGLFPNAAREHLAALDALTRALAEAEVAYVILMRWLLLRGPVLLGTACWDFLCKGLGTALGKPLIPVDHVNAHIHATFLGSNESVPYDEMFRHSSWLFREGTRILLHETSE